jgi:hypothetical protein
MTGVTKFALKHKSKARKLMGRQSESWLLGRNRRDSKRRSRRRIRGRGRRRGS